jgi:PST family polysaccharide transporter
MLNLSELLKKPMAQNFAALVVLQGINYLLELFSAPFLIRMLGVERWGLVAFGYTISQYLVLFTDFGFNLSGTKYISAHQSDIKAVNRYLNSAFLCRIGICLLCFFILLGLITAFDKFAHDASFYLLFFGIVIGNVMFPMWFFQGMEKMKYITVFNVIAKLVSLVPFFLFIRRPEDYMLVPVFYSIGFLLAGFISVYMIYWKEGMRWFIPDMKEIWFVLKDSSAYFMSRLSVSLYTYSNAFLLGIVCGNTAVGYYAAAEKLYKAYNFLLTPFTGVLFPHMANKRDVPFFKRVLKALVPLNIVLVGAILACSALIMRLYCGAEQPESLAVFRLIMIAALATIPSMLIGYPFIAAMGHAAYTNWTIVIVSVVHVAGLMTLFFSGYLSIYTVPIMVIVAEFLLLAFRVRGIKKYKLFSV